MWISFPRLGLFIRFVRRALIEAVPRIDFRDLGIAHFCLSSILRVRQSVTPLLTYKNRAVGLIVRRLTRFAR